MRLSFGGSYEDLHGRWRKFYIELDETDLERMILEAGLRPASVTTQMAYQLLAAEGELLEAVEMGRRGVWDKEKAKAVIQKSRDVKDKVFAACKPQAPALTAGE